MNNCMVLSDLLNTLNGAIKASYMTERKHIQIE